MFAHSQRIRTVDLARLGMSFVIEQLFDGYLTVLNVLNNES